MGEGPRTTPPWIQRDGCGEVLYRFFLLWRGVRGSVPLILTLFKGQLYCIPVAKPTQHASTCMSNTSDRTQKHCRENLLRDRPSETCPSDMYIGLWLHLCFHLRIRSVNALLCIYHYTISHYILSLDVRLDEIFYTISYRVWIKRVKEILRFFEFFVYNKFAFCSV